jgi:hypothetical protein
LFFPALGLRTAAVAAFVAVLLTVAALPALELLFPDGESRRAWPATAVVPGTAVLLAVACAAVGLAVDRFDVTHPVPSQLVYALDRDSGRAWWASTETRPGEYTSQYVDGRGTLPVDLPYLAGLEVAHGDAQPADLPAPQVTTMSDGVVGGKRQITVRITPQRPGVRLVALDMSVDGGTVVRAQAAGRAVPDVALGRDSLHVTFHAPPAAGLQVSLTLEGDGPVALRATDGSDGLDGLPGYRPRPDGVGAAGTHSSDLVLVSATTSLGQVRR